MPLTAFKRMLQPSQHQAEAKKIVRSDDTTEEKVRATTYTSTEMQFILSQLDAATQNFGPFPALLSSNHSADRSRFLQLLHALAYKRRDVTMVAAVWLKVVKPHLQSIITEVEELIKETADSARADGKERTDDQTLKSNQINEKDDEALPVEPLITDDGEVEEDSDGSASSSLSASRSRSSRVFSLLYSLQHPAWVDLTCSWVLDSMLSAPHPHSRVQNSVAKEALTICAKLQELQHRVYTNHIWDLSIQMVIDDMPDEVLDDDRTALFGPSTHELARRFLTSSSSFNPFHAQAYVSFIHALMLDRVNQIAPIVLKPPSKSILRRMEADVRVLAGKNGLKRWRRLRREAKTAAKDEAAIRPIDSEALATTTHHTRPIPKLKAALQLFNRLIQQPQTSNHAAPSSSHPAASSPPRPSSTTTSSNTLTPSPSTSFHLKWARLGRVMSQGAVKIIRSEVHDLHTRYANIFKQVELANKKRAMDKTNRLTRHSASLPPSGAAFPGSSSEREMLELLQTLSQKKRESIELLSGITRHILYSFLLPKQQQSKAKQGNVGQPANEDDDQTNLSWRQWQLIKQIQCVVEDPFIENNSTESVASSSSSTGIPLVDSAWNRSQKHRLPREDVAFSRQEARTLLIKLFPQLTAKDIDAATNVLHSASSPTPSFTATTTSTTTITPLSPAAREVVRTLRRLVDTHLELVHVALGSYIHLAKSWSKLERQAEKVRKYMECEYAKAKWELNMKEERIRMHMQQQKQYQHQTVLEAGQAESAELIKDDASNTLEELPTGSNVTSSYDANTELSGVTAARTHLDQARQQLATLSLPPTPLPAVHGLLQYMSREAVHANVRTFKLLLHRSLFGGGDYLSVRYADSGVRASTFSSNDALHSLSSADSSQRDLEVVLDMINGCSPAFRRDPRRIHIPAAKHDLINTLLLDVLMPKPITLHDVPDPQSRYQHSPLLESYTQAVLRVMDKQRRQAAFKQTLERLEKQGEDMTMAIAASVTTAIPTSHQDQSTASISSRSRSVVPATLPSTPSDPHRLLSRVLGTLDFIHSHPERRDVTRAVDWMQRLQHGGGSNGKLTKLGRSARSDKDATILYSRRMAAMGFGRATQRMVGDDYGEEQIRHMENVTRFALTTQGREKRHFSEVAETSRERQHELFHRRPSARALHANGGQSTGQLQLPVYIIPLSIDQSFILHYAAHNDLPAALRVLDRIRHAGRRPQWEATLALIHLAASSMQTQLLNDIMHQYGLPFITEGETNHGSDAAFLTHAKIQSRRRQLILTLLRAITHSSVPTADGNIHVYMRHVYETMRMLMGMDSNSKHSATAQHHQHYKRSMDDLWRAWVARGGWSEVLRLWDRMRWKSKMREHRSQSPSLATTIDSSSVDHFLAGLLSSASSSPSTSSSTASGLTANQVLDGMNALLHHLVAHNEQLTPAQINLIASELPLTLSLRRPSSSLSSSSATDRVRNTFSTNLAWVRFCQEWGIDHAMRQRIESNAQRMDIVEARKLLTRMATPDKKTAKAASLAKLTSQPVDRLTPSALRARALMVQLSDLNANIGGAGINRAIDRIEDAMKVGQTRQTKTNATSVPAAHTDPTDTAQAANSENVQTVTSDKKKPRSTSKRAQA